MLDKYKKEIMCTIGLVILLYFIISLGWSNRVGDINGNSGQVDFSKSSNIEVNQSNNQSND